MESKCFSDLYNYFINANSIVNEHGKPYINDFNKHIPLPEFRSYSLNLASKFIGEYNRNLDNYKDKKDFVVREFKNYKYKFNSIFQLQFGYDFDDDEKNFNMGSFPENEVNDELTAAIKIKWEVFHFVINYINKEISKMPAIDEHYSAKKTRTKAQKKDFYLKLSDEQFADFYTELIASQLIDEKTDRDNFIKVFTGKEIDDRLIWKGDQYSLYSFIRALNEKDCFPKKLYDGIWDIVADRFKPQNRDYYSPQKLKHSSPTKSKDYSSIEDISSYVHDLIKGNDEY